MGVLASERIKLTSTRSPWWCAALTAVFALGLALAFAAIANSSQDPDATGDETANSLSGIGITGLSQGMPGFGYLMIMIMATLAVTSEYRFGTIKASFLATPHRTTVLLAKAGLMAALSAVLCAVLTFLSFFIFKGILDNRFSDSLSLTNGNLHIFYAVPIFIVLVVFLAVGVGALIRQSAGALSLLLVWPVVLEPMAAAFGEKGRQLQVLLPFQNAGRFLGTASDELPWHWGQWGGLIYFTVFVAIVFGAALYVVNQRDA
ncbi:ABC transporter permease [Nocardia huaxiensis]|uniref:ABC transporter permease n=1 Tax=Nocardia huaxiensis TaxID=2755382 RepID=A0A7D6ZHL2_9NOCA|nr:ABC transporter permease [Nocardia huaxiensis]QLY30727.1 ABC transporter permease [Nocardia huaxiensis]UFS94222.1 ABC transporter permease [Nocardia huaxiensis]